MIVCLRYRTVCSWFASLYVVYGGGGGGWGDILKVGRVGVR